MANAYYLNSAAAGLNIAFDILAEENGCMRVMGDHDDAYYLCVVKLLYFPDGLKAAFADIDETKCLAPQSVKKRIMDKTKAVMFVGLGSNGGHYPEIVKICEEHGLKLILDVLHTARTRMNGVIPGKEADVVVYSFQAVKNLLTADSGVVCFKKRNLMKLPEKRMVENK